MVPVEQRWCKYLYQCCLIQVGITVHSSECFGVPLLRQLPILLRTQDEPNPAWSTHSDVSLNLLPSLVRADLSPSFLNLKNLIGGGKGKFEF